jgi:hypothetical protein
MQPVLAIGVRTLKLCRQILVFNVFYECLQHAHFVSVLPLLDSRLAWHPWLGNALHMSAYADPLGHQRDMTHCLAHIDADGYGHPSDGQPSDRQDRGTCRESSGRQRADSAPQ